MSRAMVLRAAGTNCDLETVHALEKAGFETRRVHVNALVNDPSLLHSHQLLAIPGGFSFGDYIASGKILANKLLYRLQGEVPRFVENGGLVIGICNGFQVLVKAGLLPALDGYAHPPEATLTVNDSGTFQCEWVSLKVEQGSRCVFTETMGEEWYLPIAHGEGKFVVRDAALLQKLSENRQVAVRYRENPNGSQGDIAGICDPSGRMFGLMPHPERNVYAFNDPRSLRSRMKGEGEGMAVFRNAYEYLKQ